MAVAPQPVGPLTVPMQLAAEMIAASPTFRVRAGLAEDDADAAEKLIEGALGGTKRIFYPCANDEMPFTNLVNRMPLVVIERPPGWSAHTVAGGDRNYLRPQGRLRVLFADRDRGGGYEASLRDYDNYVGGVLMDAMAIAAADGRLTLSDLEEELPPVLPKEQAEAAHGGYWWISSYLLSWS